MLVTVHTKSHRSGSCGCEAPSHDKCTPSGQHDYLAMGDGLAEAVTLFLNKLHIFDFSCFVFMVGPKFPQNESLSVFPI